MSSSIDEYRDQVSKNILSTWKNLKYFKIYSDNLQDISDIGLTFLAGGKRTRAILAYYGALAGSPTGINGFSLQLLTALVHLGSALEFYQASALIHDDIIDNAESRRGLRTAHLQLADLHRQRNWQTSASHHGLSAAVLVGDLWLSLAQKEVFKAAISAPINTPQIIDTFNLMTEEVAIGQYLDIRLECLSNTDFRPLCETIMLHKSARYSVAYPLLLGAKLAGADEQLQQALFNAGEHWGIAFQMRDDELGIFGNPELTGKTVGGDLAEGKKTLLYALLKESISQPQKQLLQLLFGQQNASSQDLKALCEDLKQSAVMEEYRQIITNHLTQAEKILNSTNISLDIQKLLLDFAQYLVSRKS